MAGTISIRRSGSSSGCRPSEGGLRAAERAERWQAIGLDPTGQMQLNPLLHAERGTGRRQSALFDLWSTTGSPPPSARSPGRIYDVGELPVPTVAIALYEVFRHVMIEDGRVRRDAGPGASASASRAAASSSAMRSASTASGRKTGQPYSDAARRGRCSGHGRRHPRHGDARRRAWYHEAVVPMRTPRRSALRRDLQLDGSGVAVDLVEDRQHLPGEPLVAEAVEGIESRVIR